MKYIFLILSFSAFAQPFKAVIFDCDGVLVDNSIGYFLDWQHALRQQDYELSPDLFWDFMHKHELVGLPTADKQIVNFCCGLLGYDCKEALQKEKDQFSKELHQKGFPSIPATIAFLQELGEKKAEYGLQLAVASASPKEHVIRHLKRFGVDHYFDLIVSGHEDLTHYNDPEGVNKPKPYIYEYAAQKLRLKPAECIVIEDSKTGVTAAVAAGCFTVAVPTIATCKQNLSIANRRLDSLDGMSCGDFFARLEAEDTGEE